MADNSRGGSSREDLTLWWFLKPSRIFLFLFLVAVFLYFAFGVFNKVTTEAKPTCGDGSFYGTCSLRKPYFCDEDGNLVEKANLCGCPGDIMKNGEKCVLQYETGVKEIRLKYFLDGEEKFIDYTLYKGVADYLSGVSDAVYYNGDEIPFRTDFKLKNLDNKEQREFILQLATEIQNVAHDENEQARIAISLVQNIPWGSSGKTIKFENGETGYSRKAYEVLYENEGLCGEKSELLAFLLRELGYGVVLFYNNDENHESVGIKCPLEKSWHGTGYCFVETSGPSILSD
ncbi:MAG: hypothetical protein AABX28_02360, partial [Nanoarchaeota archaeon]